MVEIPEYIYLIPELVSLTGMTDDQRSNFQTMKSLAPFTKLSPEARIYDCNLAAKTLNKANTLIKVEELSRELQGYSIPPSEIKCDFNGGFEKIKNGNISLNGFLFPL